MDFLANNWLSTSIIVLDFLIIAVLLPIVIMQRRQSGATLAWVLAIIFLPIIGLIGFWLFGTTRLYLRRRKRRKVEAKFATEFQRLNIEQYNQDPDDSYPSTLLKLARRLDQVGPMGGNAVELYYDGQTCFNAIESAIAQAKHHIHLLYYIWEADSTGERVRDALTAAAQRGVEVRVLVDDVGSRKANRRFFKTLIKSGGSVGRFLKVNILSRRITINNRNHRKIIVIDGNLAFTGGMNIGDEYAGLAEPWQDLHAKITGPVAKDLQETFCEDWFHATKKNLVNNIYFPICLPAGTVRAQFLASGPADRRWQSIYTMLFAAMGLATERIWLETPYFVPDEPLITVLQSAALRGVDVRLLVPAKADHALVHYAGRSFMDELLNAGARIFAYQPAMLHSKAVMIDSNFATLGSTNMDQRSFRLNFEGNLFFYDSTITEQLQNNFQKLCTRAHEITLIERKALPKWERFKERSAHLLAPLL